MNHSSHTATTSGLGAHQSQYLRKSVDLVQYDLPRFGYEPNYPEYENKSDMQRYGNFDISQGHHRELSSEMSLGEGTEDMIRIRAESIMEQARNKCRERQEYYLRR